MQRILKFKQLIIYIKKKHENKFFLFTIVGLLKYLLVVLNNWILIDLIDLHALISAIIVTVFVMIFGYYLNILFKTVNYGLIKYILANSGFNILIIIFIYIFVEIIGLSGFNSSIIAVGVQFVLRYIYLNYLNIIRHES